VIASESSCRGWGRRSGRSSPRLADTGLRYGRFVGWRLYGDPCHGQEGGGGVTRRIVPSKIPSTSPYHEPWALTAEERQVFREIAQRSRAAKLAAARGDGPPPIHPINVPALDVSALMPTRVPNSLRALSLFSGGGGLDLGFSRAGFEHMASYEIMEAAAATLVKAQPEWAVFGGTEGDVRGVDWRGYRSQVDVVHGGPPCQPFSAAGRQRGGLDDRDMWPEFVRAVTEIQPASFVGENVPALASAKFTDYVNEAIVAPLEPSYVIHAVVLQAADFGVPQVRKRIFFVGFRSRTVALRWRPPQRSTGQGMGMREALGLPDIGYDDLSPTIRSSLTGPRHTTSILNSVAARRKFEQLQVWPNGVAPTREAAHRFVAPNGHFRLSVPDVALLQGFPDDWPWVGATYMALGQIGNAVPPPMAYALALSVSQALVDR
jgi:DNA (cytosine-5)-methyltransferase 1